MKNSIFVQEVVLGLVLACLVAVEASYPKAAHSGSYSPYKSHQNQQGYNNAHAAAYSPPAYSSPQPAHSSRYGPYHSYAAKPAIYGGYKLYHYVGYTRHLPPPPLSGYKKQARTYPSPNYGLKPVKAVALAPEYPARPARPARPSYPARPAHPNKYPKPAISAYPPPADYPRTPYQARPYSDYPLEAGKHPRSPYRKRSRLYRSNGHPAGSNNGYDNHYNSRAPRHSGGRGKGSKSNSYKAYSAAY